MFYDKNEAKCSTLRKTSAFAQRTKKSIMHIKKVDLWRTEEN